MECTVPPLRALSTTPLAMDGKYTHKERERELVVSFLIHSAMHSFAYSVVTTTTTVL